MPRFETEITLNASVERVFEFVCSPRNHERLSPPNVGLKFIDPPDLLAAGMRFRFKVRNFGMIQTIEHEITEFEPPLRFVEVQVQGPLQRWVHRHEFRAEGAQTMMRDAIDFEPPTGFLGMLATADVLLESLEDAFYHRHRMMRKLLESPG